MISQKLLFLSPYIVSFTLSVGIGVYAMRHKAADGALAFAVVALSQAFWTLAFIFELTASSLEAKIFWDNLQFAPGSAWMIAFLAFVLRYGGHRLKKPKLVWALIAILPALSMGLVFTDPLHGLIRTNAWLKPGVPFSALEYDFTPAVVLWTAYHYLVVIAGLVVLIGRLIHPHRLYRAQVATIALGALIPLGAAALQILRIRFTFHRDMLPFTFGLSDLIMAWGLFRFRLLDIVPAARGRVIEDMRGGVMVLDNQDRIADLNPAAVSIIGYPAAQAIGGRAEELIPRWPELAAGRGRVEVTHGKRDFDVTISPLQDRRKQPAGRLLVWHDISPLKQAEQEITARSRELEVANAELKAAQDELLRQERLAAMGELVAVVSHELRNPLGTVANAIYSIQSCLKDRDGERIDRSVVLAQRNIKRCAQIVDELLDYARKGEPYREPTDIDSWLGRVLDEQEFPEGLTCHRRFDFAGSMAIDREQLRRAVVNVITNAIQATQETQHGGGMLIVETSSRSGRMEIRVVDNGPGVAEEARSRIFEPLFSTRAQGIGLGMPIVKRIMEAHGGGVDVVSKPGEGATVTLWVPRV